MARLGIQAAEALEHAHQMGVVHRDIKPSNLMVEFSLPARSGRGAESPLPSPSGRGARGEGPRLWITDFGLARIHTPSPLGGEGRGEGATLTMTGDVLGTLRYMSPEQLQAKHGVLDHRTDVYSLGLTLYELLTLQPAFPGDDRQRLIRQITEDDPPPPRQLNKSTPKDLETIILKATAKEPQDRYATAQQFADDLRRFLDDKPIRARRPTLVEQSRKWGRRHRPVVWSVGALMLITMMGLAASTLLISQAYRKQEAERQRAEQNLNLALQAMDRIYLKSGADIFFGYRPDDRGPRKAITPEQGEFFKEAIGFYEEFARANRDNLSVRRAVAEAYGRVGVLRSNLGMHQEAEDACGQAIELAKSIAQEHSNEKLDRCYLACAYYQRGLARLSARRHDQAIADLTEAIALNPREARAYVARGNAYVGKGEHDKAMADYNEATQLNRRNAGAYNQRGIAYAIKGEFDRAIREFDEAIRIDPKEPIYYTNRGCAYKDKGDLDRAICEYTEAIRIDPTYRPPLGNRGAAYAQKGSLDLAIADFTQHIQLFGETDPAGYRNLALAYSHQGDFDAALEVCDRGIQILPEASMLYEIRGSVYANKGEFPKALQDFNKALELGATGKVAYDTYCGRGNTYSKMGRWDLALAELNKAIEFRWKGQGVRPYVGAYCCRAEVHGKLGQVEYAQRDLGEVIEMDCHDPLDKCGLAWFLATCEDVRVRRVDRALELAQEAVHDAPNAPLFWNALGAARYRAGDCKGAIEALVKATELGHYRSALTWFFQAMAHWQLGEKEEARKWYDKAVQWMQEKQPQAPDLCRFRAEAAELLGVTDAAAREEGTGTTQETN